MPSTAAQAVTWAGDLVELARLSGHHANLVSRPSRVLGEGVVAREQRRRLARPRASLANLSLRIQPPIPSPAVGLGRMSAGGEVTAYWGLAESFGLEAQADAVAAVPRAVENQ